MGWSQQQLAKALGTAQSVLSHLESGATDPRLSVLERWAAALGTSLEALVAAASETTGWSLELARQRHASERAYQKLADDCWRGHDYLAAIRWRGVVEGLQIARDHHLDVLNPKDEK